jgi:NAD(P)-dependent dehydrogenase (short-subunit alcohol dehydrogenase family)
LRLQGKVALITGGSSGIGLATAKLFVAEGAQPIIIGRNQGRLDAAVAELGPDVLGFKADVTDVDEFEAALGRAASKVGRFDILFANAGVLGNTPVGGTSLVAFETLIRTNLTSVFFTVQAAVPHLNDRASIVLNGSVISVLGTPGYAAYAATKAGVRAMARVMASELSPRGIRVNVVSPGGTRTPIWGPDAAALKAVENRVKRVTPLGRMGEVDDISKTVLFLASDDASHVQGQEILVDGGATASPAGAPVYRG